MTDLALRVDEALGGSDASIHADGIYFDLPFGEYLADPALGSGSMKQLAFAPCDYWWGSWMNPQRRPEPSTSAQRRGTAIHTLVFHGEPAFDRYYMRGADNTDDMTPAEKSAATKAANKRAAERGLIALPAEEYDRVALVCAKVMKNPYLLECFSGGAPEVSVFWTELHGPKNTPMRKKARFDYLKPRGIGDLKSVANQHEMPFPRACITAITNYHYEVQAKHYLDARARLPALIEKATVYAPMKPGAGMGALLEALVKEKRFAWQWVFWQSERAPVTWSRVLSPQNPILELAGSIIHRAEANYLQYLEQYGTSMWIETDKPVELFIEEMPAWFGRD